MTVIMTVPLEFPSVIMITMSSYENIMMSVGNSYENSYADMKTVMKSVI